MTSRNKYVNATMICRDIVWMLNSLSYDAFMLTSSNGNIFRVTGPLWGESTGHRWFPSQRPVARSFDVFFDSRLNKRLSKHFFSRRRWSETTPCLLWRHCNLLALCASHKCILSVPICSMPYLLMLWRTSASPGMMLSNMSADCLGTLGSKVSAAIFSTEYVRNTLALVSEGCTRFCLAFVLDLLYE